MCHQKPLRTKPDFRFLMPKPQHLRSNRLRRHLRTAALQHQIRSKAPRKLLDLLLCPCVNAIQDCGPEGAAPASTGSRHGPIPDTATAATRCAEPTRRSRQTPRKSCHHTRSGSCSAHPGCGKSMACPASAVATTEPSSATRTPLVLEEPMSSPRTTSVNSRSRVPRSPRPSNLTGSAAPLRSRRGLHECDSTHTWRGSSMHRLRSEQRHVAIRRSTFSRASLVTSS